MERMNISTDEIAAFCKNKGFVYPSSDIYGAVAGFFDYGPLGVELKNNVKAAWWKFHVQEREDIIGLDGAIITNPKVWKASGHLDCFEDVMVECVKCHERHRGDVLIEDSLNMQVDGLSVEDIDRIISQNGIECPSCGGKLSQASQFNLMFHTHIGPKQNEYGLAYLRPETAQSIFANFKLLWETNRVKLPFGVAQIGKAFRNEISPRNFLFRCREFEQMEIEYFIHPDSANECPYIDEVLDHSFLVWSADMQKNDKKEQEMTVKEALDKGIIKTAWHAYWLAMEHQWFVHYGADPSNFRVRQHLPDEKSHYAVDTWDLEYLFPWGWKELEGMANRTDFDLKQHMKESKRDLHVFDEERKQKVLPHVVAEPSLGVDRAFMVFLFDTLQDDKERGNKVLRLHPKLAPVKVGVFPLVNKIGNDARKVYESIKRDFVCIYDKSGSIGRRYARADEIGVPYCVTADFDTEKDHTVTIRDRDSTRQVRVPLAELRETLKRLINGEIGFEQAGV